MALKKTVRGKPKPTTRTTTIQSTYQDDIEKKSKEAIEKYHGLSRIEDQFRVMKSDLETRPVYVRTREHIEAHLLICLIALTMIRMIQCKICQSGLVPKSDDATLWSMGLPAYRIQNALNKWKVELLADDLYRFTELDHPDLKLILDSFAIKIPANRSSPIFISVISPT